ncbi:deoxyguanosinetriphosphate triphosphohydrolase [Micromonospora aurantiaca]|uniref:Deoxyguanosinetriphosphate triphosphohydrolase-like protein n=1 Tax=Micromonospora aurantiaca (nom. illeg.) TaxID=47850 RepID=A0A1C6TKT3_9ACTN|nr:MULTISPECIES: deoxyguanosinetriphosphate triphosphohydrolase [Micromonospora]ADU09003.1 deoxyguanosinetriphosphate triphosphohydrolase [Micromonospora sp. L5]AXH88506.1 deoxyguanosinetriphosphate triphosphohydrolase [Micromonospora aurantiaca]MBC9003399.1 deoxyguanosinetriphosphate triphosphohydrolase [Micromonospora aurantiaca]SCL42361.1 dGTPase [Micromonospora aurantiaca]
MSDAARLVDEAPKDTGYGRSPFERDRARVLHSAAFRRLAAKTQVHTAGTNDFLRTRLTHSLEVAQIAREMGARLGCDPDVVDTAGLAHDLGHPPFGHNGEYALDELAADCGGFEGNAQTLRVLTRLEAKVLAPDGRSAGLNLTRAALDAVSKYPWPRRPGERKFGVYADDRPVFDWLREGAPPGDRRCLEAQVMDWADDVAYSVHDVEDGIHGGYVDLRPLLADADERRALCADVAAAYSGEAPEDLGEVLAGLLADPVLAPLAAYDGSHRALAALKATTSVLTGRFVAGVVAATEQRHGPGPHRRYDADLEVPRRIRAQCALLKGIALRYVMRRPGAGDRYARQRDVLTGLVAALLDRAPDALDPVFAPLWRDAADDAARLRVVIDQVASLTDPAALAWHARLVSPS